ncbi:hypothetical protein [Streptomyces longwoodensis]|uniref:hypothetical protein n=1 Tax=Streptomyces longwoodensis TaxID=68231 RepID=UPI0036ED2451
MIDRADDINRDMRKATRRTFKSKKNKKRDKGARKLARRNSEDIRALAAQVALLSQSVSALTRREAPTDSPSAPDGHRA